MRMQPSRRNVPLSREQIRQITDDLITHLTTSPPLQVLRHGTGIHLRLDYEFAFLARIDGGTQPYAWHEVVAGPNGTFTQPAVARTGTTSPMINEAWETNGNTMVAANTIVLLTRGAFNFNSTGQEYLFSYSASSGQMGQQPQCCAVPLRITSLGSQNGLYPAVVLAYSPATNTFSDTAETCWALTTQQNLLQLAKYTGINVGTSGGKDIFCISENLTISDSLGLQALPGSNQVMFDVPPNWSIRPDAQPGQAIVERLFRVQDERQQPPVDHVQLETFFPYFTWDISKGNPNGLEARIRRRFEVYTNGALVQQDVFQQSFTPACTWDIGQDGPGSVHIRRLFRVQTDSGGGGKDDVALLQFQPASTWNIGILPCGVTIERRFEVYVGESPVQTGVFQLHFTPSCAWEILPDGVGAVTIRRLFTVQTNTGGVFNDVAGIRFSPACTWDVQADNEVSCGVTVKRKFQVKTDVGGGISDVASLSFEPACVWSVLVDPSAACGVTVKRNFTVTNEATLPIFQDIATIRFQPAYCWSLSNMPPGGGDPVACTVYAQRILIVNGSSSQDPLSGTTDNADIFKIVFNTFDFTVTPTGTGVVKVTTRGLSIGVCYCGCDGNLHTMNFQDGLLQSIT